MPIQEMGLKPSEVKQYLLDNDKLPRELTQTLLIPLICELVLFKAAEDELCCVGTSDVAKIIFIHFSDFLEPVQRKKLFERFCKFESYEPDTARMIWVLEHSTKFKEAEIEKIIKNTYWFPPAVLSVLNRTISDSIKETVLQANRSTFADIADKNVIKLLNQFLPNRWLVDKYNKKPFSKKVENGTVFGIFGTGNYHWEVIDEVSAGDDKGALISSKLDWPQKDPKIIILLVQGAAVCVAPNIKTVLAARLWHLNLNPKFGSIP